MFEKIFLKECTELNHDQQFKIKIFIVFQMCAKLKKNHFNDTIIHVFTCYDVEQFGIGNCKKKCLFFA